MDGWADDLCNEIRKLESDLRDLQSGVTVHTRRTSGDEWVDITRDVIGEVEREVAHLRTVVRRAREAIGLAGVS